MGFLRALLACGVLLSHAGGFHGYVITGGTVSVQCFYVISGFFISLILNEKYNAPGDLPVFYTNRFLRIFTLYWIFAACALVLAVAGYVMSPAHPLGPVAKTIANLPRLGADGLLYVVWANFGLLGHDASLFLWLGNQGLEWTRNFNQGSPQVFELMLVPQAWSLSLELMFYALAPLVVRRRPWVVGAVFAASLGLRLAGAGMDLVDDPWSYRFFPFELSMFLAGALSYALYRRIRTRPARPWEAAFGLALIPAVLAYPLYETGGDTYFTASKIVLYVTLALGLPYLYRATRSSRFDRMVGELSYPIYLSHIVVLTALGRVATLVDRPDLKALLALICSVAVSWAVVKAIDEPLDRFRQNRLKRRHALAAASPNGESP